MMVSDVGVGGWGILNYSLLAGSILPAKAELFVRTVLALSLGKRKIMIIATISNVLGGVDCYYEGC